MLTRDNENATLVIITPRIKFIKILTMCEFYQKNSIFYTFFPTSFTAYTLQTHNKS